MKCIMFLDTVPEKFDDWYSKAIHFQNQWDHVEQIAQRSRRSTQTFQSFSSPRTMTKDPNTMDVNAVKVKKLTPEEQEECFKKRLCLRCHKKGHMANACPIFSDPPKKPHIQHAQKEEKLPKLKEIKDDEEEGVALVSFRLDKDF